MAQKKGTKFETITGIKSVFGEETEIKHTEGEVILLDFWATWCPPCQEPMAHNHEMLEKHKGDDAWKNIRIVGLSIDDDSE